MRSHVDAVRVQQRHRAKRRQARRRALLEFGDREPFVAVLDERLQQWIVRVERLNPDLAGAFGASRASRHLNDQLCRVFGCAEVGAGESGVGVRSRRPA